MSKNGPELVPCPNRCMMGTVLVKRMATRKNAQGKDEAVEDWEESDCKACDGSGYVTR